MSKLIPLAHHAAQRISRGSIITLAAFIFICGFVSTAQAQRKPLPKPPSGARGFEQYAGKDASSRLIAAGSTRGVGDGRKPDAPLEGLAFDPHPMFKWEPIFGTKAYRFTLYDGDVYLNPKAPVVYETQAATAQLIYPNTAKPLVPGKLYSWRVGTPATSGKGMDLGRSVNFFVLNGEDAMQLKTALAKSKLIAPKTVQDRLRQAHIFEEYGVWYDALRIANELAEQNPNDAAAQAYYDSLMDRLEGKSDK